MLEDIKQYVARCERCQATKPNRQPKRNYLYPNEVPQNPWEIVSIDLIGPLLESVGYDGILVIVDRFSKMARYVSQKVTYLFCDELGYRFKSL